jgi:hypothetical protein
MIFDFSAIKKSLQSLESRLRDLRNEKLELQKKREAIQYAPASKEDVKSRVATWLAATGAAYNETLLSSAEKFARSPHIPNAGRLQSLTTFSAAPGVRDDMTAPQELGQALCALLGPILNDALMKSIDAMPWSDNAVPLAKRADQITALNGRISKLQDEENEIITKAQEAGLNLE